MECRSADWSADVRMSAGASSSEDMGAPALVRGYAVVGIAVSSISQSEAGTYTGEPDCASSA